MPRLRIAAVSFLFVVAGITPAGAQEPASPQQVVKLGSLAPEGSTWMDIIKNILFLTESRGSGKVKTIVYGGGVMGDEPDMVRKLRLDQLQMGAFTVQGMMAIAPEMSILELPFLFEGPEEVDFIREKYFSDFEKFFLKKDFILVTIVEQGFIHIYTKTPARTPDDLAKQKMWVWADEPVASATFDAMGIRAIPLPVPDVLSGLQTGLINAIYTSPMACLTLQWFSQIKYIMDINLRYEPGVVVMTKKAWDRLDPKDKKAIIESTRENTAGAIQSIRKDQARSLDAIVEAGVKTITLTPEEIKVFRDRSRSVWNDLAGKMFPRALLQDIVKSLEEYRKKRR